ncbi:hypothetical protein N7491_003531 [Penicillium cf. griseofulvum]|uniref:Fucose-specific lectin n=1 Tax=Penicillium cf. griseofulvum TaxID=2972120 RepID=A0A9W9MR33_9EURO|nr:hypothetical protein N7472_002293 [Penicillium cf. griseofulvum]KAJ5441125.1 hypothetical protein N7491_003531 [Penicillium cf. griseofulvum]KAJ5449172.1 hypothetical protein N7445_003993 [Penicillium cf. griseofulvum]
MCLITNTFYFRLIFSSSGTASTTQIATSTSNSFNPSPTGGSSTNSDVNNAWAYNGTSIMSLTFSTTKDTTGTNYVVFYQHSNGDIRQVVYNNSQWHSSQYINNDARPGSPITAYWGGDSIQYNLFYVDKNNVLQETRGSHASNSWLNGTLGQLGVLTSDPGDISVVYVGDCAVGTSGWLLYSPPAGDQMGVLYWDGATDTWSHKGLISDVKPGAGFAGHADVGVWRYYYVQQSTSQLKEQVCPDCCSNSSSIGWRSDLTGPTLNSEGGLSVSGVGLPRLIYYGDENGSIRELNNSYQYPNEAYMADVSSHADGGNTGTPVFGNMTASTPSGMVVATGIPNGKVSMASGFRGKVQQLWLFYQVSGHDITVQVRDSDAAGNWTEPSKIPVGVN